MADNDVFVDDAFERIAAGRVRPVYGMNFTPSSVQLSELSHPHLARSVGINVPTYYLAGR